ncbi:MAG TPA: HEAT repeat domain-containing protein [Ktedonobacterales bacterium]
MVSLATLADLMKEHRAAAKLTQEALAEKSGVSVATISDIESGRTKGPHKDTIKDLARALGLNEQQTQEFAAVASHGRPRVKPRRRAVDPIGKSEPAPPQRPAPAKPRGNGTEQEAGEVLRKRLEVGPDGGRREADQKRGAQRDAAASALGFTTLDELREACQLSVESAVRAIPKYTAVLFVEREGIQDELERFLSARQSPERSCFLVLGQAGAGKTNVLCHLAMARAPHAPTLLLRGTSLQGGRLGFWKVLAEELSAAVGRTLDPAALRHTLPRFLAQHNTQLLIFVDAINENAQPLAIAQSLGYAAHDAHGTPMLLCLSCRDIDWRLFDGEELLLHELFVPNQKSGQPHAGWQLGEFSECEFEQAWRRYARTYRVTGTPSPQVRDLCLHPLMLRFLCEAFARQTVPAGIHRKEIFDTYWAEKLRTRRGLAAEEALYRIIAAMYTAQRTELSETQVVRLIGDRRYQRLRSERVIIYSRHDPMAQQHFVGVTYEAFLEYAIARHLLQEREWAVRGPEAILADLRDLQASAEAFRNLQGVMVYLLLSLGASPVARDFLRHLAGQGDARWRIFVCDFVTKLADPDLVAELVPLLTDLSHDDRFPVRWAAANALGIVAQTTYPDAARTLDAMADSREWMEREVAALAATHFSRDFPVAAAMLERLADDINWRVRRAVGSSLNHLCRSAQEETFTLLWSWTEQRDRWRLRRAVAQAKYGLLRDPTAANTMLATLAADQVAEIRWRVVSDLVALMDYSDVRTASFALLLHIASNATDDAEIFVRRHVAFWLPEICLRAGDQRRALLEQLTADNAPFVRWEAARALSFVADEALAAEYLDRLKDDDNADVRFAAQYSRAALGRPDRALDDLLASSETDVRLRGLRERLARSSRDMKTLDKRTDQATDMFHALWRHDRYGIIREVLNEGTSAIAPEDLQGFFTLLSRDEDEGIRWALAGNLAEAPRLEPAAVIALLLGLIGDSHYWTRRESAASLGKLAEQGAHLPEDVVGAVRKASGDDENAEVRFAALACLVALRDSGGPLDIAAVEAAIAARRQDEDRQVREYAESISVRVN